MRTVYCSPVVDVVELVATTVIAASVEQGEAGVAIGSGTVNPDEAWTGEARNDWSHIWDSM